MSGRCSRDAAYISHMLDCIAAVESFIKDMDEEGFKSSRMKQSAVVREVEVIGEAAKNISQSIKDTHSKIPWKDIIRTRDKMIHHYFGVDLKIIWNIITIDLPSLKKEIEMIRDELEAAKAD